jgi:general secretion pathway protein G
MRRSCNGFTIIEMMVVLTMLAVLAMATAPVAQIVAQRAKERELKAALLDIRTAIDAYKRAVDEGRVSRKGGTSGYPPNLEALVDGVPALSGDHLRFLRRIPSDPLADEVYRRAKWGLRSYASSADHPMLGEDVYDVYSLAPGVGLDGTEYRLW